MDDEVIGVIDPLYAEIISRLSKFGIGNEYDWLGDWQGPGCGTYVIRSNGKEMEPGDVVDLLDRYADLLTQTKRTVNDG